MKKVSKSGFSVRRPKWRNSCAVVAAAMCGSLLHFPTAVMAQDDSMVLTEIVVTARKRDERLQDMPVSISAFSGADLEARSIENLSGVGEFTPNLTFNNATEPGGSNSAQVFIRGVGQQDFLIVADPGVGIYNDGVYLGRATGGVLDITDVAQVEVLRGPQGTLFGRNTIGGAINIVPNKPTGEHEAYIEGIVGTDNRRELNGMVNVPISDTAAARFAGHWLDRDGFGRSSETGQAFGDDENFTLLGQFTWEINEDLNLRLSADLRQEDKAPAHSYVIDVDPSEFETVPGPGGNPIQEPGKFLIVGYNDILRPTLDPLPPPILGPEDLIAADPSVNSSSVVGFDESSVGGLTAWLEWQMSDTLMLRSISGYRTLDVEFAADNDSTLHPISEINADIDQSQFSQEFQLLGSTDRLNWVAGLYYFTENAEDTSTNLIFRDRYDALENSSINIITIPCAGAPIPGPPGCAGNPANIGLDTNLLTTSEIDVSSIAAFLHGDFQVTDIFSIEAGIRYSREEKDFTTSLLRLASGIPAIAETTVSDDWGSTTPRLSFNFQVMDGLLIYASASHGFKSGTFNGRSLSQGFVVPVEPEELLAYELGLKSTFADGKARLNAALFYNDYEDIQLQFVEVSPAGAIVQFDNAGDAEITGGELELMFKPTTALDLSLALGYLDSELTSVDEEAANAGFVEGTRLSKTPELTAVAAAQYTHDLARGSLVSRLDYAWTDDFYHQRNEDPLSFQEAYGLLGARVAYISADEGLELAVFGTNLTDESYFNTIVVGSTRIATGYPARGRQWGLSLKYRF